MPVQSVFLDLSTPETLQQAMCLQCGAGEDLKPERELNLIKDYVTGFVLGTLVHNPHNSSSQY